ncbi:MAG: DUF4347 domain-containing protein, partial [Chroococcales cyanobacterium]
MVIIDPNVDQWQILAAGVRPNTEVHILDPNRDGIEQITEILSSAPPCPKIGEGPAIVRANTLHLISHGTPGTLYLGNSTLELNNLEKYRSQLQ